tara:strand:- start:1205 stop:1675 length:471 start_codon:yes stop_codon:yes gene_type:complete
MDSLTLYFTLLTSGFVLIGIEIFIPGGILGIIGAITWLIASYIGWHNFDYPWNTVSSLGILFILILTLYVWIRFFPKSKMGKSLTLTDSITESSSYTHVDIKIGDEGQAVTTLRPAGIASINDQRVDVVTNASWIEQGAKIKVIDVHKGHVEVQQI